MSRTGARPFRLLTMSIGLALCCGAGIQVAMASDTSHRVSIYAGSRGNGVPAEAMRQLVLIERYLGEQKAKSPDTIWLKRSVVGLEGETVLCVEMPRTEEGARVLERVKSMVAPVAMLSLSAPATCSAR